MLNCIMASETNGEKQVLWNKSLYTGIEAIDNQHKYLIDLTDKLIQACIHGGDIRDSVFKETLSHLVEYVRDHFTYEQELFKRINYPKAAEHKSEHDILIQKILEASKSYSEDKNSVPNELAKSLKDWIVSHIGYSDKMYAFFISDQKKKGILTEKDITD